ncbi:hypothetical protein M413DRAFT_18664 [Hebeloma cylindrosporum]|uniref:Cytochrome P450 n=1 Tax=Hebeloma cylindrosporum TaxID=76867 RepID=A0A0C3CDW5_HEBCY|nr:hypothetical protein M413DRAFT_18664 [Hebeloma cylindrosporum h7]
MIDLLAGLAFIITLYLYVARIVRWRKGALPLPPGPKRLPLVGNLFVMPKTLEWETYHQWSQELNTDVLHVDAAGTNIIVLDSYQAAVDLLEKRSSIYSGRPRLPMVNELMGWDWNFGFMDYGARSHRKIMHHSFHPSAAKQFLPHELKAARRLLRHILEEPVDLLSNLRHFSGEVILSTTYGLDIASKDDKYITLAKAGVDPVVPALNPGTYLVDVIPALKYVPDWVPGAGFKKTAKKCYLLAQAMKNSPFEAAKYDFENGTQKPSLCSASLRRLNHNISIEDQEDDIKSVAGTLFADSSMGAVATAIIALMNHPEVLKKAHEEIDKVIKPGKLPDFADEPSLPYITAIVKETMRWRPTAPLALPHLSLTDDVYRNYRIPKGSIILANAWAMLHDENIYPDPFAFKPERFLTEDGLGIRKDVKDPGFAFWGFGRRICPGRYMAASSLWITIASLIAAFNITKIPEPFQCSLKPRSKEIETQIRATALEE